MTQTTEPTAARIRAKIYYQLHGEFYSLETANEEVTRVANTIADEIDALTSERNHALAEVSRLGGKLAEAQAEVERLQTAAEAFWAYEVFTATYLREDRDKFAAAAARARAAKGQK